MNIKHYPCPHCGKKGLYLGKKSELAGMEFRFAPRCRFCGYWVPTENGECTALLDRLPKYWDLEKGLVTAEMMRPPPDEQLNTVAVTKPITLNKRR